MARRKKRARRGIGGAVGLLCVGIAFVAYRLSGLGAPAPDDNLPVPVDDVPVEDVVPVTEETAAKVQWRDLLAVHGSYHPGTPVRQAFAMLEQADFAAPLAETDATGRWNGDDPPFLRLGLVMVSERARRAVLADTLVGIGDTVSGCVVEAIQPGAVVVNWRRRRLTYDLDGEAPREFRRELALRAMERVDERADERANDKENGK